MFELISAMVLQVISKSDAALAIGFARFYIKRMRYRFYYKRFSALRIIKWLMW